MSLPNSRRLELALRQAVRANPRARSLCDLIQRRATLDEMANMDTEQGMKFLSRSALDKVEQGLTSLEEALTISISEEG